MSGIGHNGGPTMEPGASWRRHCWRAARRELLPAMPLEVVRHRVERARALGLDYKTYAGIRASTGRDIVAFLFSSNALRVDDRRVSAPVGRATKLRALRDCGRLAAIHLPLDPSRVITANPGVLDLADRAPTLFDSWSTTRARLLGLARAHGVPGDGILVIGETALEREWCATARMAGFLHAERYFGETVHEL